jgi:predicted nucleic acid-binding protein
MRIALDTNVLAYAAGVDRDPADAPKIERAKRIISDLAAVATLVAPVQVLGELFIVLQRGGYSRAEARAIVLEFREALGGADSASDTLASALDLSVDHQLQFWDALILSASVAAGCGILLSEDMQDGFVHHGLTIVNPFTDPAHRKLAGMLTPR